MGPVAPKQLEVVRTVVRPVSVEVVYNLSRPEQPAESLFHHESVFPDVSGRCGPGMVRPVDKDVSVSVHDPAATPRPVTSAGGSGFPHPASVFAENP